MNASTETNFSCFRGNLSLDYVTDEAWSLGDDQTEKRSVVVISSILVLFMLVKVPWNLVVLATLIYNKCLKQPSTFLLFNLALVDLSTCALVIPFQVAPGLFGGVFNLGNSDYRRCQSCRAGVIMIVLLLYMSIHLITVMSVDRLVYIKYPIEYEKRITVPCMALIVFFLWIFCLILSTFSIFQFGAIEFSAYVGTCTTVFGVCTIFGKSFFYVIFLVLEVMIPLDLLVVANIWLLHFVVKISRVNQNDKKRYHNQQMRMLTIFGSIFIANFITCIPSIIAIIAIMCVGYTKIPAGVFGLVFVSFLSQYVIHPMVETCLVKKIRKLMKMIFCFCCCSRKKRSAADILKTSAVTTRVSSTNW